MWRRGTKKAMKAPRARQATGPRGHSPHSSVNMILHVKLYRILRMYRIARVTSMHGNAVASATRAARYARSPHGGLFGSLRGLSLAKAPGASGRSPLHMEPVWWAGYGQKMSAPYAWLTTWAAVCRCLTLPPVPRPAGGNARTSPTASAAGATVMSSSALIPAARCVEPHDSCPLANERCAHEPMLPDVPHLLGAAGPCRSVLRV